MLRLKAVKMHQSFEINTGLFGSYNLENVRAAIATGLFLGVEIQDIIDVVENYVPANNRSQVKDSGTTQLICDSYNANPTSMGLAIEAFSEIKAENKLIILGDMLELGEKSEEEHMKLLKMLQAGIAEKVFLVGPVFQKVASEIGFKAFDNVDDLIEYLKSESCEGKYYTY